MLEKNERMAYWLLKDVNHAIRDYQMIQAGDRVAVALSGGKDSLTLLRLLDLRRKQAREAYDICAITVLGDANGPSEHAHQPLLDWLEQNHYHHTEARFNLPDGEPIPLDCHRCTWNRRRILFETASQMGCNVVAMGHHADDLAQTTLLNLVFHGRVETMEPRREYFDGQIRMIRPLCYLPEAEIRRYARAEGFPPPPPECPRSEHSQRKFIAGVLREINHECHSARTNLLRAGLLKKS
jgi:tRNA 2-thiocytidine biosynthesis protein TtcA